MKKSYEKTILRNLYLIANHHGKQARFRSNDSIRKEEAPHWHWQDQGTANAYEAICFYLMRPELIEGMDYNKIFGETELVPSWLQDVRSKLKPLDATEEKNNADWVKERRAALRAIRKKS